MKKAVVILLAHVFFYTLGLGGVSAAENQFVTIVNPVRVSLYTESSVESFKAQYKEVSDKSFPATWLLTYDALQDEQLLKEINKADERQEFGIFLEVTPEFSKDAGVVYNDTGFWHHATSVFLSGYLQEERKKLIDTVFEKFKENFGYYPKSVGSWWTDSYSLTYIKEKYGIVANLGLADQFSTDGYQVWGQYWSIPYYPSKYHTGVPASNEDVKLDVVVTQWAPRDPYNGYFDSYYSTQDYFITKENLGVGYFKKLVELYAFANDNKFGYITVGLEGDLSAEAYGNEYKKQLQVVELLEEEGKLNVVTLLDFANWYRNTFPKLSPPHAVVSNDLLGEEDIKVIWYQTSNYRIGILYDIKNEQIKIFDFRTYHKDMAEPYYLSPNKEFNLTTYIPSHFDVVGFEENVWNFNSEGLETLKKRGNNLEIKFTSGPSIMLEENTIHIDDIGEKIPDVLADNLVLEVEEKERGIKLTVNKNWIAGTDGEVYKALSDVATHHLVRKRTLFLIAVFSLVFILVSVLIIKSRFSDRRKIIVLGLMIVPSLFYVQWWLGVNTVSYYISQAELDTLYHLSIQPDGDVLVYDNECLGCQWHSNFKPAAFANKRDYVEKFGKHPIIYNSSVFRAMNQAEAREDFKKLDVEYIYLVKYENYVEKTPFSPGDLGIEKIYTNANSELWRVKSN